MILRPLDPDSDDFELLTALLHRAYSRLAEMGLNFTATDQKSDTTRERCSEGECWVAESGGVIVGTIVWGFGGDDHDPAPYREPGIAHFNQFAVEPALQRTGIGDLLLAKVEKRAQEAGYHSMTLDTAEPAEHLIAFYSRRGYEQIATHQWGDKCYRSVILSKDLR